MAAAIAPATRSAAPVSKCANPSRPAARDDEARKAGDLLRKAQVGRTLAPGIRYVGDMVGVWRGAPLGAVVLAGLGLAAPARAVSDACFDSYERTQRLRKEGKLVEAADQAAICAADSCPGMIKNDCARWKSEIAKSIPTVVFAAEDDQGKEVAATTVFVDDRKVA